ncbi:MAG: super-infection exclusion protein B [Candidatus Udaeobacter sp.]
MPVEFLSRISDLFKLTTKQFAVAALTTGTILFLPVALLQRLGLDKIPAPYGTAIGVIFIVSSVFVLVNTGAWCVRWFRLRLQTGERFRRVCDKMYGLDSIERSILQRLIVPVPATT